MDVAKKIHIKLEKILNRLKVLNVIQSFNFELSFCQIEDSLRLSLMEIDSILKKCLRKIIAKPRKAEIRNVITELVRRKNLNRPPKSEDEKVIQEEHVNYVHALDKENEKFSSTRIVESVELVKSDICKEEDLLKKKKKKLQKKLRSFLCELCGIKFHNIQKWKFHSDRHREEKKFEEKCFALYPKIKTLENHIEEKFVEPLLFTPHDKRKITSFSCCDISFCTKALLSHHKTKEHQKPPLTQQTKFTCKCGKTFRFLKTLRKHESLQHSVISIVHHCSVCKKQFKEKGKLNRHMLSHQTSQYCCRFCLKHFTRSDALKRHLSIAHYPQNNFSCSYCDKKFNLKYNKDVHEKNVHKIKGDWIVCEKCGHKYKNKLTFKSHLKIHTEERIICSVCGKPFSRKIHYKNHMKTKHEEIPSVLVSVRRGRCAADKI